MDAGENPDRAAERECLEETGLTVSITGLLDVMPGQAHARGADILIVYRAEILAGAVQAGDDADQVDFFDLDNLPPLAFTSTQEILLKASSL
jgi:8-oxo-dGTP diphosphatase